ncbi:MAG: hypothetical protein ACD_45C00005G0009 [uncultured bacterium]|nr:MAG: hypothetical protein ACD_45C00005G0009 [uncultured bacterium]
MSDGLRERRPQKIAKSRENSTPIDTHQFRHLLNTMAQRDGLSQSEIARWSGRADIKQNRVYDHMSEFELVIRRQPWLSILLIMMLNE